MVDIAQKDVVRRCPAAAPLFRKTRDPEAFGETAVKLRESRSYEAWEPYRRTLIKARVSLYRMEGYPISEVMLEQRRTSMISMASGGEPTENILVTTFEFISRFKQIRFYEDLIGEIVDSGQGGPDLTQLMAWVIANIEANEESLLHLAQHTWFQKKVVQESNEIGYYEMQQNMAVSKAGFGFLCIMDGQIERGKEEMLEGRKLALECKRGDIVACIDRELARLDGKRVIDMDVFHSLRRQSELADQPGLSLSFTLPTRK